MMPMLTPDAASRYVELSCNGFHTLRDAGDCLIFITATTPPLVFSFTPPD